MGRLVIVCTRMSGTSSFGDEYQKGWKGPSNTNWMLFRNNDADTAALVVRGCMVAELVSQGKIEEAYHRLIGVIREAIGKATDVGCQNWEKVMAVHKGVELEGSMWGRLSVRIFDQAEEDLELRKLREYKGNSEFYRELIENCLRHWQKLMEG